MKFCEISSKYRTSLDYLIEINVHFRMNIWDLLSHLKNRFGVNVSNKIVSLIKVFSKRTCALPTPFREYRCDVMVRYTLYTLIAQIKTNMAEITAPARFPMKSKTVQVTAGEAAHLQCAASGDAPLEVSWRSPHHHTIAHHLDQR